MPFLPFSKTGEEPAFWAANACGSWADLHSHRVVAQLSAADVERLTMALIVMLWDLKQRGESVCCAGYGY